MKYIADTKTDRIIVRAKNIEEAAQHAVNRLVSRAAIAYRQTGDDGLSGVFQAYVSCHGSGISNLSSRGPNIHVMEQGVKESGKFDNA